MDNLKNLGRQTPHVLAGADHRLLEVVRNPMRIDPVLSQSSGNHSMEYDVALTSEEFTSLCPATGGPDFGTIIVEYRPNLWIVESKSFKYYLESFRNEPMFHEQVVSRIVNDLAIVLRPRNLNVTGKFKARGGITIEVDAGYYAIE